MRLNKKRKIGMVWFAVWGLCLLVSCGGNEKTAEKTAKEFLHAYYIDLDYVRAMALSTDVSHAAIRDQAEITGMNPYAKEETPDIVFKRIELKEGDPERAKAVYTANRIEKELPLRKLNGKWLIDLRGGSVETGGNADGMFELSSGEQGGFTSAASGPIQYKKREKK